MRRLLHNPVFASLTVLALSVTALQAQNARAIMDQVDEQQRRQNNSSFTVMQLSTCKIRHLRRQG